MRPKSNLTKKQEELEKLKSSETQARIKTFSTPVQEAIKEANRFIQEKDEGITERSAQTKKMMEDFLARENAEFSDQLKFSNQRKLPIPLLRKFIELAEDLHERMMQKEIREIDQFFESSQVKAECDNFVERLSEIAQTSTEYLTQQKPHAPKSQPAPKIISYLDEEAGMMFPIELEEAKPIMVSRKTLVTEEKLTNIHPRGTILNARNPEDHQIGLDLNSTTAMDKEGMTSKGTLKLRTNMDSVMDRLIVTESETDKVLAPQPKENQRIGKIPKSTLVTKKSFKEELSETDVVLEPREKSQHQIGLNPQLTPENTTENPSKATQLKTKSNPSKKR